MDFLYWNRQKSWKIYETGSFLFVFFLLHLKPPCFIFLLPLNFQTVIFQSWIFLWNLVGILFEVSLKTSSWKELICCFIKTHSGDIYCKCQHLWNLWYLLMREKFLTTDWSVSCQHAGGAQQAPGWLSTWRKTSAFLFSPYQNQHTELWTSISLLHFCFFSSQLTVWGH